MAGLMLTFHANPAHLRKTAEAAERGATQESAQETTQETAQEKILQLIRNNPSITRKDLADKTSLSPDGAKYHLNMLKKQGRIKHTGATKKGKWELIE
jgi:ATP-dependent DNA helicase RecG